MKTILSLLLFAFLAVSASFSYNLTVSDQQALLQIYTKIDTIKQQDQQRFSSIKSKLGQIVPGLLPTSKAHAYLADILGYMRRIETPIPPVDATDTLQLDLADRYEFLEVHYVEGSIDAPISIVEFSDFECPFCKRHAEHETLAQVRATYPDQVNTIYAHFPLSFHPHAQKAAEAAECVAVQGGETGFYEFKHSIFGEASPDRATIDKIVEGLGYDAERFAECLDGGEMAYKVALSASYGKNRGITGTPGNLVIDTRTGEYIKVSGAVPASSFDDPVQQLLAN